MLRALTRPVLLSCIILCTFISCREPDPPTLTEWTVSPYPNGRNFAFTILHDADSAYSRRLAPLFQVFDALEMKITATVFALWAEWADDGRIWSEWNKSNDADSILFIPVSVPLEDEDEKDFYRQLDANGHEIALHSPSEISDTRDDFICAYELYRSIFGEYPQTYVEHSRKNNKEAQANEGADPESPYYCTDLLNSYRSWVWVDGPGAIPPNTALKYYDILASYNSPFNDYALKRYGILRGFRRTGRWRNSNGDGFLEWYSEANIDSLESNRGTALVFTHLNYKWLDPTTQRMRNEIHSRLEYLVSKDGWFVPACEILDRFDMIENVHISTDSVSVRVVNGGSEPVDGLTLITHSGLTLARSGEILAPNGENEIVVGDLEPYATIDFKIMK